jgi:hypothetical protein
MTLSQEKDLKTTKERVFKLVAYGSLSVKEGAELLGLTRQGFWYRRKQVKKYGTIACLPLKPGIKAYQRPWNRTCEEYEEKVVERRSETGEGAQSISWYLEEDGIKLTKITVHRILIRKGIIEHSKKGKREYKRYVLGYPGAELQYDWTQIEDSKERFWVAAAVDDHTRWGFAKVYLRCTAANAIDFLGEIVRRAPFDILAIRTDQGSEVSKQFTRACLEEGILHIRNRVKTPRHNGKVERFHRTVQEECLWYHWHWKLTPEDAQYRLTQFLAFYNFRRHHQGLGMNGRTPNQQLMHWIDININELHVKRSMIPYRG